MRNGIYRVWYKNTEQSGSAAVIMTDGWFIACDRTHNFLGRYTDINGLFTATVAIERHNRRWPRPEFPDLDTFHMEIEARSTGEIAIGHCTYPEQPGAGLDLEYVWYGEI